VASGSTIGVYNGGMSPRTFLDVDPATLHLPVERIDGADPAKLQRQIARHGKSLVGMPRCLSTVARMGNWYSVTA
jgi:hypothetical protein